MKTKDPIKKGQFAVEYVGEVLTEAEAEERGKKYGKVENKKDNVCPMCLKAVGVEMIYD